MEDYLLTVPQVAERLKINKNFVYKLIDTRLLRALKLGSLKVRNTELNRFLQDFENKDLTDLGNIKDLEVGAYNEV